MSKMISNVECIISLLIFMIICPTITFSQEIDRGRYEPTVLPDTNVQVWVDLFPNYHGNSVVSINQDDPQLNYDDALYIDTYSYHDLADVYMFSRDINASNDTDTIEVEAMLRLDAYEGQVNWGGCMISAENDTKGEVLLISPNKIRLFNYRSEYLMDTTDDYHTYRMTVGNGEVKVYVDGSTTPDLEGTLSYLPWDAREFVAFGEGSQGANSMSSWAYVKYSVDGEKEIGGLRKPESVLRGKSGSVLRGKSAH